MACRRSPVHHDAELRHAHLVIVVEVGGPPNILQHADDLFGLGIHDEHVGAKQLNRQLALGPGECLVHVVFDRLRKVRRDAWYVPERFRHRLDQLLLVRGRPPLLAWPEAHIELDVVRRLGVGAVIGGAKLRHDDAHLWELEESLANLPYIRAHALDRDADRELDTHPEVPLVQLGEEFLAQEREDEDRQGQAGRRARDGNQRATKAPAEDGQVRSTEPAKERSDGGRRKKRPQSTGISVSVSSSDPTTANEMVTAIGRNSLPSIRWKVRIGTYTVMMMSTANVSGRATSTAACCTSRGTLRPCGLCWLRCRTMFSVMMTAPSTMIPKSIAPNESRLAGIPRRSIKMNANKSESGIVSATMKAARTSYRNSDSRMMTSPAPSTRFLNTVVTVVFTSRSRL